MKNILLFLTLGFPLCLIAQERFLEINTGSLKTLNSKIENSPSQTVGYWGYHFGAAYTGIIAKKVMFKSGIRYSMIKSGILSEFSNGVGGNNTFLSQKENRYVEIPLLIHQNLDIKGVYAEYGLSLYWLKQLELLFFENGKEVGIVDFPHVFENKFRCYLHAAYGYQYAIKNVAKIFVQSEAQARLNDRDQLVSSFQSNSRLDLRLGFTLGCRFIIPKKTIKIE